MRKINPISKTVVNNSQNPSQERVAYNNPNVPVKVFNKQGSISHYMGQVQIQTQTKNFSHTAKVSYNNSPSRSKVKSQTGSGLVFNNQ